MIREHELLGHHWFIHARHYMEPAVAATMFERIYTAGAKAKGKWDCGVYRMSDYDGRLGTVVAVVSHRRPGVEWAERVIAGGTDYELLPGSMETLILRRARVIKELTETAAEFGAHRYGHGEGERLRPDGTFE